MSRSPGTYKAVTESPAAKAVIDAGRRKIADRVSPDPAMVTLTPIDADTAVLEPETVAKKTIALADALVDGGAGEQRPAAPTGCRGRCQPLHCGVPT